MLSDSERLYILIVRYGLARGADPPVALSHFLGADRGQGRRKPLVSALG